MTKDLIHNSKLIGENLKKLRTIFELTLDEAAVKSGLSKSFISLVESGHRKIKTQDLRALLNIYGYSLSKFLSHLQKSLSISEHDSIVSAREKSILLDGERNDDKFSMLLLRPVNDDNDIELIEIYLPPNSEFTKEKITMPCSIRGIVYKGNLLIEFSNDEFIVSEEEEFTFDGNTPFNLRNYTKELTKVLLILQPPVF